jgi:hypothetical protein
MCLLSPPQLLPLIPFSQMARASPVIATLATCLTLGATAPLEADVVLPIISLFQSLRVSPSLYFSSPPPIWMARRHHSPRDERGLQKSRYGNRCGCASLFALPRPL